MIYLLLALMGVALRVHAQAPQPDGAGLDRGVLPASWPTGGPKCMEQPDWRVHEYNPDFYIIRESGCVHFEKPFLYLIFGRDRAILVDTGAGKTPLAPLIDGLIAKWRQRNNHAEIKLLVTHSHGHDDHKARDSQFQNRAGVEVVPPEVPSLQRVFGIKNWPVDIGSIDLGGRVLDAIPIPGHQQAAMALYDRRTGILLTGDSVYPGRLYVEDWNAFAASTRRLVDFSRTRLVSHVLGNHIEQTSTPFLDYPIGSMYQPREHVLELSRAHLLELDAALNGKPRTIALRDMSIFPTDDKVWEELQKVREETERRQRLTQWDQAAP